MARRRKATRGLVRHVQQEMRYPNKAGDLRGVKREVGTGRGGRKRGRPKKPGAGVPHRRRPAVKASEPVQVTIRVLDEVGRLRTRSAYAAVREAAITVLKYEDFRLVHISIQGTHVHLLVEATNREWLARGMQAFQISAAKHLNAALSVIGSWWQRATRGLQGPAPKRRRGRVFRDRYHATVIRTPRHARNELAYVLNNWRKHDEHRRERARTWLIDPFATGWAFDGWKEREGESFAWKVRDTYQPMPVWRPKSWLLTDGWRRYGLISTHEVPIRRAAA